MTEQPKCKTCGSTETLRNPLMDGTFYCDECSDCEQQRLDWLSRAHFPDEKVPELLSIREDSSPNVVRVSFKEEVG